MNFVQPIRCREVLREMKRFLRRKSERNYMLFLVGIYSGLRVSDILKLRVEDVKKNYLSIREQKTRKQKRIPISPPLRRELDEYIIGKEDHEFLFQSREGINQPIGRSMAYKIIREAAEFVSLDEIGTHSMRKTFGYHFYMRNKDIAMLQEIFNHSSQEVTLKYIGINQDGIDRAMQDFRFD